jgi:predicted transcriptional regulator
MVTLKFAALFAMSTTSLKLPDELKGRIVAVAEKSNRSPHALMLDLLEKGVAAHEQRQEFVASALKAKETFDRTRMGYDADEIFAYFDAKIEGRKSLKPKLKKWPR